MSLSGIMMIVNSEQKVKEEDPFACISSEQTLSTLLGETPLAGICNVETKALQAPITSTGAADLTVRDAKMTTLQASNSSTGASQFPIWEDKEQTSDQFVSQWSEAIERLRNICSTEFKSPSAPISPTEATQLTGREERTQTSEQAVILSEVVEDFIEGLENLCLLEDRHGVHSRRSPLPVWYPRRPLQDITAVLNIGPVPPEEASNLKKGSKKAQTAHRHGHFHDNRGRAFGEQRAPRVPFKPISSVLAAPKRSSLLRKGFR